MGDDVNLRFLGTVSVSCSGRPIGGFRSRKALALLGYLAVQPQPTPREQLAALFWEAQPEARGRANLSWVLNRISSVLPGCLHTDLHSVAFQRTPTYEVDVDVFARLLARGDPAALAEAVDLYRGEFLAGMALDGCAEFEIWLEGERERWRQRVAGALEALVAHYHQRGAHGRALAFAQRLLALKPWQEHTHRQVMEMLARDGRRDEALLQYETCRRMLAQELGVEPMPETTALYARIRGAPPPRRPRLPAQPTPFLGRAQELARLAELLADPDCRLLTILGPAGIGKTRLALQAAEAGAGVFLEGVHFVPLASVSSPELVVSSLAEPLQIWLSERQTPESQLLSYLRGKELLLILDGFEHLLGARELLVRILQAAPQVKLLVTSHECLNLRWEWRFEIEGLAYPAGDAEAAENPGAYAGLQLFAHVARRMDPSFSLTSGNGPAVGRICRLLEGMPLGIELAAAWVGTHSCEEIAREIEGSLGFLATSMHDVPERHASIHAAFEHSWRLLTPAAQRVLARLSAFRSAFAPQEAAQVAGASPADLGSLAGKSLLRHLPPDRYEMLAPLRQQASAHLAAVPAEHDAACNRHCACIAADLQQQATRLAGHDVGEAVSAIRAQLDDVRAAWSWAATHARVDEIARALGGLSRFYLLVGPFGEGEALLRLAIERLRPLVGREGEASVRALLGRLLGEHARFLNRLGRHEQAVAEAAEAIGLAGQAPGPQALSHLQWGEALLRQADLEPARAQFERALSLAHTAELPDLEAECLSGLAGAFAQLGDVERAGERCQQALALSRALGDPLSESRALNNLGVLARRRGDYRAARASYQQALSIKRTIGHRRGEAIALGNLGIALRGLGEYAAAKAHYEEALHIYREIGDRQGEADVLNNLGGVCTLQDDHAAARRYRQQALEIHRETGDRQGESRALGNLGATAAHQGDYGRAVACLEQALRLYREVGDRRGEMQILDDLGLVFTCLGAYARARPHHEQAVAIAREVADEKAQADVLWHLALLCRHTGDARRALEHARQALAIARRLGNPSVEAQALACMSRALEELGELDEAATGYRQALELRRQLGEHNRATECLAGLARLSLAGGALAEAGAAAGEIWQHLQAHTLEGALEPGRVYLTCYSALRACRDPRAAAVLAAGRRLLEAQAARIDDEALRRSFLQDVPAHRELRNGARGG